MKVYDCHLSGMSKRLRQGKQEIPSTWFALPAAYGQQKSERMEKMNNSEECFFLFKVRAVSELIKCL